MPTTDAYNQIAGADLPSDWCRAELRQTVRTITPQWHEDRRYEPACDNWMRGFDLEFTRKLAGSGLLGMNWPGNPEILIRQPEAAHAANDRAWHVFILSGHERTRVRVRPCLGAYQGA